MALRVKGKINREGLTESFLRRAAQQVVVAARGVRALQSRLPKSKDLRFEVALLSSREIRKLNLGYRGKDQATDVLSFPTPPIFFREGILGDVLVCGPVARRQARELGHSAREEGWVLLVHGFLHLLGLDHEAGGSAARQMAKFEGILLKALEIKPSVALIERVQKEERFAKKSYGKPNRNIRKGSSLRTRPS